MKTLSTSYYSESISLRIYGDRLIFEQIPTQKEFAMFMVYLSSPFQQSISSQILFRHKGMEYRLPSLPDGNYYLNIFSKPFLGITYYSYFHGNDIILQCRNHQYSFQPSPVLVRNGIVIERIPTTDSFIRQCLAPSQLYQVYDGEVQQLARTLSKGLLFPYSRIKNVHDWVAQHISYDYDSLENGSYLYSDVSAKGVLSARRTVCSGYTNLSVALLRAMHIPSLGLNCFSLGVNTLGGWENSVNLSTIPNHILTLAYVNNRWMIMDVTWDSDNTYRNGQYGTKMGGGSSYRYFDTTIQFISKTHRFLDYQL